MAKKTVGSVAAGDGGRGGRPSGAQSLYWAELLTSTHSGLTASFAAKSTSTLAASAATPYAVGNPMINRSSPNSPTLCPAGAVTSDQELLTPSIDTSLK